MGRYLAGFALGAALVVAALWIVSVAGRQGYKSLDYPVWTAKMQLARECRPWRLAILGDSRASAGLIPDRLAPSGAVNLALPGGTPVEAAVMLQHLLRCPVAPERLLVSFSPRQFADFFWFWRHDYGFFSTAELDEIRRADVATGQPLLYGAWPGARVPDTLVNWLYAHGFPSFNVAAMVHARVTGRRAVNRAEFQETLAGGGFHTMETGQCATVPAWEAQQARFAPSPLADAYLGRLLDLAARHGIPTVMLSMPSSALTAHAATPAFNDDFRRYVDSVAVRHPAVRQLGPAIPVRPDCAFSDDVHLNRAAAAAFSDTVAASLLE